MQIEQLDHLVMIVADIEKIKKRGKENAREEKSLLRYVIKINPKT